ncbi:T9SS type A sorting domain-containing protein [candidate division WOR-3 bacterium]|nr:T9SS type A sorting domain-containing protein [candidate division WOR-3 bacterium]
MKRLTIILLPVVLFGLERVNLIKNGGFEDELDVWGIIPGASQNPNPAIGNISEDSTATSGLYSASVDTRHPPTWTGGGKFDSVAIKQEFITTKRMSDIDSLYWKHLIVPRTPTITSVDVAVVGLTRIDPERNGPCYQFLNPEYGSVPYGIPISEDVSEEDLTWRVFEKSLHEDFLESHLVPADQELGALVLIGWGIWFGTRWDGQKIFFDDIRLMGYADYDVGVKEITSPDGGEPYTPEARIKNFGREPVDSFLAIATIRLKEGVIFYADTLTLSLPADTEDTISFKTFPAYKLQALSPGMILCTLSVRTVMDPDECDEDDELLKELILGGIAEPSAAHPNSLDLKVNPICSGDVHVSYSLPKGYQGNLTLYDASGRRVDAKRVRGYGSATFDANVTSGVYFIRLSTVSAFLLRKVVITQ